MRMVIFDEGGLAKCIRDIRQLSEYTYANLTDDAGYTAVPIDELIASIIHVASVAGQVNGHLLGTIHHECIEEFRSEIIDAFFIPDMVTVALDAKVDAIILAMAAIFNAHYVTSGCFKLVQLEDVDAEIVIGAFSATDYTEINAAITSVEVDSGMWGELLEDEELISLASIMHSEESIYDYRSGRHVSAREWCTAYCSTGNKVDRSGVSRITAA